MNTRDNDIVENAAKAGNFNWLGDALKAAGLVGTYKGTGPFTFFAPTDEAFEKIPPGALRRLLEDKAKLAAILNFHVMPGAMYSAEPRGAGLAELPGRHAHDRGQRCGLHRERREDHARADRIEQRRHPPHRRGDDARDHPMTPSDPDFEALKSLTRLSWLLNFEAVATVGNDEDAIAPSPL